MVGAASLPPHLKKKKKETQMHSSGRGGRQPLRKSVLGKNSQKPYVGKQNIQNIQHKCQYVFIEQPLPNNCVLWWESKKTPRENRHSLFYWKSFSLKTFQATKLKLYKDYTHLFTGEFHILGWMKHSIIWKYILYLKFFGFFLEWIIKQ